MKFWITQHCQDRYLERVNNGLYKNENLRIAILKELSLAKDITDKIHTEIPRYILYLLEKYKEAGQRILLNGTVIFIVNKRKGTESMYDVYTCYHDYEKHLEQYRKTILSRDEIWMKIKMLKKTMKK
jgi:hypothetical protein